MLESPTFEDPEPDMSIDFDHDDEMESFLNDPIAYCQELPRRISTNDTSDGVLTESMPIEKLPLNQLRTLGRRKKLNLIQLLYHASFIARLQIQHDKGISVERLSALASENQYLRAEIERLNHKALLDCGEIELLGFLIEQQVLKRAKENEDKVSSLEEKLTCKVCFIRQVDRVFSCGHTICNSCLRLVASCPMRCDGGNRASELVFLQ